MKNHSKLERLFIIENVGKNNAIYEVNESVYLTCNNGLPLNNGQVHVDLVPLSGELNEFIKPVLIEHLYKFTHGKRDVEPHEYIGYARALMEGYDLCVNINIMSPVTYVAWLRHGGHELRKMNICVIQGIPDGMVFALPEANFFGAIPYRDNEYGCMINGVVIALTVFEKFSDNEIAIYNKEYDEMHLVSKVLTD